MQKYKYTYKDLDDDTIQYVNYFFKAVIINTKRAFLKKNQKHQKYNISFVELDRLNYEPPVNSEIIERGICKAVKIDGLSLSIQNWDLAEAIEELPPIKKIIVLENIALGIPLQLIADRLEMNLRTVKRYKQKAIIALQGKMEENGL